jgi:L-ascorbate metabolism protein UlaG (beta-lactamase superfamily)
LLLDKGANINAPDQDGRTPLTFAAWSRNPDEMSKFFILNGADVNPDPCKEDKTCTCGPAWATPLHVAARHGQLAMVKNLVSNGARVNVFNNEGLTPLHSAVLNGDEEVIEYLLEHGAFINVAERNTGSTELHLAVAMGFGDVAASLVEHGGNLEAQDERGMTPLDYAWYYGHKDLAYELLAAGANDENLVESVTAQPLLAEEVGEGEAKLFFLGHSGWAVKTQEHFLVFDYFCNTWEGQPDDSCFASGHIIPEQIKDENVTVFCTHRHGDHFDRRVFSWKETIPDINYVLCWDAGDVGADYTMIPVHEEGKVDDMDIYVHHSTDLDGGYLVEVDGLVIMHMGDHANGEDGLMAEFTDEIDIIAEKDLEIDILFGGIRGCSLGEPEQVKQGLYYTLNKLQPKLFVPMHSGGHSFAYKEFVETAEEDGITTRMKYAVHKGDRFEYKQRGSEIVSAVD